MASLSHKLPLFAKKAIEPSAKWRIKVDQLSFKSEMEIMIKRFKYGAFRMMNLISTVISQSETLKR